MPAIAILDDRKNDRETTTRVVESTLKKLTQSERWSVVADAPPPRERDVLHWLDENDATVLLTDWKLNEGAKNTRVVNYEADRLVKEIRKRRPTFPVFVITGFESEARTHLGEVENIFSRQYFVKNAESLIPQMIRAGLRRYDEQRELLTKADSLARAVAAGRATRTQRRKLRELQACFQGELPLVVDIDTVLRDLEGIQTRAHSLRRKVERRLSRSKGSR